jgi:hypothetical protein
MVLRLVNKKIHMGKTFSVFIRIFAAEN